MSVGARPSMPDPNWRPDVTDLIAPSGRYAKACAEGRIWCLATPEAGVAPAAANLSPAPALTGAPILGIYNPGAGFKASILRTICFDVISPADGIGVVWNGIPAPGTAGIPGSTGLPARNASTLQPLADGSIQTYSGGTPLGIARGVLLRAVGVGRVTSVPEETAGSLLVLPGNFLGLYVNAVVAGNVFASIEFEILSA